MSIFASQYSVRCYLAQLRQVLFLNDILDIWWLSPKATAQASCMQRGYITQISKLTLW